MDYLNRFFTITFIFFLVLALPPLTIWAGRIVGRMKGWQWSALPVIIYTGVVYIIGTSVSLSVMLTGRFGWDKSAADTLGTGLVMIGFVCCLGGFFLTAPSSAKPTEAPESE